METLGSKAFVLPNKLPSSAAELGGAAPSAALPVEVVCTKGRTVLTATVGGEAALEENPSPGRCQGGRARIALESKKVNRENW